MNVSNLSLWVHLVLPCTTRRWKFRLKKQNKLWVHLYLPPVSLSFSVCVFQHAWNFNFLIAEYMFSFLLVSPSPLDHVCFSMGKVSLCLGRASSRGLKDHKKCVFYIKMLYLKFVHTVAEKLLEGSWGMVLTMHRISCVCVCMCVCVCVCARARARTPTCTQACTCVCVWMRACTCVDVCVWV